MGTRYNGWMQACWPEKYADKQFRVWFPKLANTRNEETMAATSGYINIISDDWNEIVFDDTRKERQKTINGISLMEIQLFLQWNRITAYIFLEEYMILIIIKQN